MTIELVWEPPPLHTRNGIIRQYSIGYYVSETRENVYKLLSDNSTSTLVTDLHPYYTYSFKVSAATIGAGPQSAPVTARTLENGTPLTCYDCLILWFLLSKQSRRVHQSQLKQWQSAPLAYASLGIHH